jgi:hypothetical protein
MLAAAVAAFFYLRVALLMYGSEQGAAVPAAAAPAVAVPAGPTPAPPQAGTGDGPEPFGADLVPVTDGTLTAGLEPVPGLDSPAGTVASTGSSAVAAPAGIGVEAEAAAVTATLEAPPAGRVKVPLLVGVALAICVVFTIVAGVSTPVITFARQATMLF